MKIHIKKLGSENAETVFDWVNRLLMELGEEGEELRIHFHRSKTEKTTVARTSRLRRIAGVTPALLCLLRSLRRLHESFEHHKLLSFFPAG
ncbi:hypothetical protein L0156_28195 [bacterium]|nr:hypothetical protein [bacterium]